MGELQALSSRTLRSPPSGSKARKRSLATRCFEAHVSAWGPLQGRRACLRDPRGGDSSRTSLCKIYARGVSGMAQAQDLRQAITSVAGRPGPVLSAYLSVNAEIPENQRRAYLVRLRDAMNDEGVPEALKQRVREYIENETHPEARALALFAD